MQPGACNVHRQQRVDVGAIVVASSESILDRRGGSVADDLPGRLRGRRAGSHG